MAEGFEESLTAKFDAILPHLDERQRRLLIGAEARVIGHGGIRLVARAAGVTERTVSAGVWELEEGGEPLGRVRKPGGGRKRVTDVDPELRPALLALVEPEERGDPMSPLRWTTKSTRKLAQELSTRGHRISADTVADVLREDGFSLQGNTKTLEGMQNPDRDAQFRYLNEQARDHQDTGDPVVSVDTKKKELVGEYKNGGREWQPKGEPVEVSTHDFPDPVLGKAIPYGIYDLSANTGWVNVGTDHDTAAFAVQSLRGWWNGQGRTDYPAARRLLITADAGGSNGYRRRTWKSELAAFAEETGLAVTVCHLPPGTSKWNRIEHRLFCHITMNWRGRPLTSHEVIVQSIAATTSRNGLRVNAELDTDSYPTGVKISDTQMDELPIIRHDWHGDWNYTLHPHPRPQRLPEATEAPPATQDSRGHTVAVHPAITGMTTEDFDDLVTDLAALRETQREQALEQRRGGQRNRAPGSGGKPKLTHPDRVLTTFLHLRLSMPQRVLALLFDVDRATISRAIHDTRQLLDQHGSTIKPTPTRLHTTADFYAFTDTYSINSTPQSKTVC